MTQLSGQQVVTEDAKASLRPLDVLLHGVRAAIDLEYAERLNLTGDAATTSANGTSTTPSDQTKIDRAGAFRDTLTAFTPMQWGLIAVATGLGVALATGQFR